MSRSYRRTPIVGNTRAASEKADKQLAARRHRRITRAALERGTEPPTHPREVYDLAWCGAKDGKHWVGARWANRMRK